MDLVRQTFLKVRQQPVVVGTEIFLDAHATCLFCGFIQAIFTASGLTWLDF